MYKVIYMYIHKYSKELEQFLITQIVTQMPRIRKIR